MNQLRFGDNKQLRAQAEPRKTGNKLLAWKIDLLLRTIHDGSLRESRSRAAQPPA